MAIDKIEVWVILEEVIDPRTNPSVEQEGEEGGHREENDGCTCTYIHIHEEHHVYACE